MTFNESEHASLNKIRGIVLLIFIVILGFEIRLLDLEKLNVVLDIQFVKNTKKLLKGS